jgi:hypothetical protein
MSNPRDPHWWRTLSRKSLATMLAEGHSIDRTALADTVYKGISLGLPSFVEALSWVVFAKTFQYVPATYTLRGWNVRCEQTPLESPVKYRTKKDGSVETFGPYLVREIRETDARPRPYRDGLMIDYSMDGHARGSMARTRDSIVAVEAGSVDVLLGWSWISVGKGGLSTPSYFALLRERTLDHQHPFEGT